MKKTLNGTGIKCRPGDGFLMTAISSPEKTIYCKTKLDYIQVRHVSVENAITQHPV